MPTLDSLSQNYTIVVGVILTLLVVERVVAMLLPFFQKKNGNGRVLSPSEQRDMYDKVKSLWEMHDVRDDDGVYRWYPKKQPYEVLGQLAQILDRIVSLAEDTNRSVQAQAASSQRLETEVRKIRGQ